MPWLMEASQWGLGPEAEAGLCTPVQVAWPSEPRRPTSQGSAHAGFRGAREWATARAPGVKIVLLLGGAREKHSRSQKAEAGPHGLGAGTPPPRGSECLPAPAFPSQV